MRELKFKAWVKRLDIPQYMVALHNVMLPVTGLHFFEGGELTSISLDTEYGEQQDIWLNSHGVSIKLLQYTGLKDANGDEIYEGDVLRDFTNEIKDVIRVGGGFILADNDWDYFTNFADTMEIIGNKYEGVGSSD